MRRFFIFLVLAFLFVEVTAFDFSDETLHYRVEYKWGLINKTAGSVSMRLRNTSTTYKCRLTASSAGWADKFFKVRDTLTCEVAKNGFLPMKYAKYAHEGGDDRHETVTYSYQGDVVNGLCTRKVWEKGKLVKETEKVLTAEGTTLDMLSGFYYMRNLPFESLSPGQKITTNIFSGKEKEMLTIKYDGIETVTYDKKSYPCFHIRFVFTSKGGKKSSDDIDAWIDVNNRIPIKMEGSLPIGKIRCFYTD